MLALMIHRSTPTTATGYSPAELAMGRRIRSTLPTLPRNLEPKVVNRNTVERNDGKRKRANQNYFNSRYGAKDLPPLRPGTEVLQKLDHERQWTSPASVIKRVAPRSYLIKTPFGSIWKNRKHLRPTVTFRSNPEVDVLKKEWWYTTSNCIYCTSHWWQSRSESWGEQSRYNASRGAR